MFWTDLGTRRYREVFEFQEEFRARVLADPAQSRLFVVEHPPTYTLGRGENGENLGRAATWFQEQGFDVVDTNRGGKITYHGPGQLVAYPVVDLRVLQIGVKDYVAGLERTMIETLAQFGIEGRAKEGWIGAWVEHPSLGWMKIGSIGIHVRKHVSIHGLALNVTTDLSHFDAITPCGIPDVRMTSIRDLGATATLRDVVPVFVKAFSRVFGIPLEAAKE